MRTHPNSGTTMTDPMEELCDLMEDSAHIWCSSANLAMLEEQYNTTQQLLHHPSSVDADTLRTHVNKIKSFYGSILVAIGTLAIQDEDPHFYNLISICLNSLDYPLVLSKSLETDEYILERYIHPNDNNMDMAF